MIDVAAAPEAAAPRPSESITRRRLRKFKRLKRGYYSFLLIAAAYILSFFLSFLATGTAYDAQLVRRSAPPGVDPHVFFFLPAGDMALFVLFFAGAVYYRKRPAQHKALMLMTAINFSPAAIARLPLLPPELFIIQALVFPALLGIVCFAWHTWKTRKFNWVFAIALVAFIVSGPFRVWFSGTKVWLGFMAWLTS